MTANKRSTRNSSRKIGSDLEKVDSHVVTPEEYEEIPELTADWFEKAEPHVAGKPVRRGRPPKTDTKQQVTLRLSPDVLEPFKASGRGWQTRIEDTLRTALKKGAAAGIASARPTPDSGRSVKPSKRSA
jgi:uncharacterized protein (DUF4415 family)